MTGSSELMRRSMAWSTACPWVSRARWSLFHTSTEAKKAPGTPMMSDTTATTETMIRTARSRMPGSPAQRWVVSKRKPIPRTVVM